LAITWSKFKIRSWGKFEIAEPFSNNYEPSKNAIKMTFFLISGQKIIMKGCARQNGQVTSIGAKKSQPYLPVPRHDIEVEGIL